MPLTIITDHASLKWLMSLKDLDGWLARWSLKLQIYNFVILDFVIIGRDQKM